MSATQPGPASIDGTDGRRPEVVQRLAREDAPEFHREALSRNEEIITVQEQTVLNGLRVLVAGCGSVGGSAIEPLVRAGVGSLVLADPDTYELNNINRQPCTLDDVGRKKVEVQAERAKQINPHIRVSTMPDGMTPENIEPALRGAAVVWEGIDPSPGPLWIKYLVHRHAAQLGIPVISGVDLGGQPTIYVFDYRRDNRAFLGKANVGAFREGRLFDALRPWIGVANIPTDFGEVIVSRTAADKPWPQVAYTTATLGALATRTIIDVALGRDVPHVIRPDLHMLTRTPRDRVAEQLRRPAAVVRGLGRYTLRKAVQSLVPQIEADGTPAGVPSGLVPVLDAIRQAPSAHNAQPWKPTVLPDGRIRMDWDRTRHVHVADPDGRYLCHGMGCAIEAARTVADLGVEPPSGRDPFALDWHAGHLVVEGVREADYLRDAGVLAARSTNRGPYSTLPLERDLLDRLESVAARLGVRVAALSDRHAIGRVAELAEEGAAAQLGHDAHLAELLAWIRFSPRELDWDDDGFAAEALDLDPVSRGLLRTIKRNPGARRAALRGGLGRGLGRQATRNVAQSGTLLLLMGSDSSPAGWVEAGRGLMALWLEATRHAVALQPVTWPLDVGGLRGETLELFGAGEADHPIVVLRAGRPLGRTVEAPRLPLNRIVSTTEVAA